MSRWLCQLSYGPLDILMAVACPEALARMQHNTIAAVVLTSESPPISSKTKTAVPRRQDDGSGRTLLTLHNLFVKQNPKSQMMRSFSLGSRREIITQDFAGFWFVYKAHPPAHIGICVGGCNAVDAPKNKQDVSLFLAAALTAVIDQMAQVSMKCLSFRLRVGCRSFRRALASIWRMRSRVTAKSCPTSSNV